MRGETVTVLRAFLSCGPHFVACLLCLFSLPVLVNAQQEGKEGAISLHRESVKLSEAGDVDKAIEVTRRSLSMDGTYAEAYDLLGQLLMTKGQNDEAIEAFTAALKINPRLNSSKTGLGRALLKKGDLEGAETALKEALRMNPKPSATHYALGLLYERKGEYDKALVQFKEGIEKFKGEKK